MESGRQELRPCDYCARLEFIDRQQVASNSLAEASGMVVGPGRVSLGGGHDLEYLMLVPVRESRKDAQGVLTDRITATRALVWLQPLNQCPMVFMDPAQGVRCEIGERLVAIHPREYRERIPIGSAAWFVLVGYDELPDEVVQRGADLMDDVAGYDPEVLWDRLGRQAERMDVGFRVVLDRGLTRIVLRKPQPDFQMEGLKCFRSPSEARSTTGEVGRQGVSNV